ncbi:MAG: tail fiber domain-containing protein [Bacteroidales bacterium]|nr:tail fiber domain-containing protein [Bacteroidales bacterium]
MKKIIVICLLISMYSLSAYSQVPEKFNYQGVLRNSTGELVENTDITVKLTLLEGSSNGSEIYSESHSVSTNDYGHFSVQVGAGTFLSGSFAGIDWSNEMYMKTEVANPAGGTLVEMGTVQLLSVPYALYANKANEATNIENEVLYFTDSDTLFAVKDRDGNIVFAVFPDGVKVYANETIKGTVGGFAVSGRSPGKANVEVEYLRVTPDSTRIYVNDTVSTKGKVGGFAVSGRSPGKGVVNDYLHVTKDSTRVYITETGIKGKVGGFAVSGRSPGKMDESTDYFNISGNNQLDTIGSEARILWYPKKEAFLTGRVLIESSDSVGTNSMATGYESKAIGDFSQAMGFRTIARGDFSTAIGDSATANGNFSYSLGYNALSNNMGAYSFGYKANALGVGCFALGSVGVDTLGRYTDELTVADGIHSFAIGQGAQTENGIGNMAIGPNAYSGGSLYSFAMGYKAQAIEEKSISIGSDGMSTGDFYPTPLISSNSAQGSSSMALGFGNTAIRNNSIAFGIANKSYGYRSISMGYRSKSEGDYSITLGDKVVAKAYSSMVVGRYNIIEGDSLNWVSTDPLFVIGNGSKVMMSVVRSNAMTVLKNGYTGINTNQPAQMLDVNGNGIIRGTIQTGGESFELNTIGSGNRYAYIDFHGDDTYTDYSLRIMRFNSGSNAVSRIHHRGTGNLELYAQEAAAMRFYTSGTERLTILSNGNIGIGNSNPTSYDLDVTGTGRFTTSAYFATTSGRVGIGLTNPSYKMDIYDNSTELYAAKIFKDYNSSSYGGLMIQAGADDGSGTNIMVACYNGAGSYKGGLAIISNGNVSLATASDYRLKDKIENTQTNGLDILMKLRVVDFEFKDSPGIKQTGYIAQEVNNVYPEMVSFNEQEDIYQISQMQLIPVLNKAIQEQQVEIESLKSENLQLKIKLEEFNKRLETLEK